MQPSTLGVFYTVFNTESIRVGCTFPSCWWCVPSANVHVLFAIRLAIAFDRASQLVQYYHVETSSFAVYRPGSVIRFIFRLWKHLNHVSDAPPCCLCGSTRPAFERTRLHQQPSPFAAYLGMPLSQLPSVPTDTIARVKEFISEVKNEIQDMENAIQALKAQHDNGQYFLTVHEGLLCRALDLPTELLEQIFLLCLDKNGCYPLFGRRGPWSLSAVCRRWRQVAIGLPKLWSGPSFTLRYDVDFESPGRMALMANRSQGEPLTLDVDFNTDDACASFDDLKDLFPRVENLRLRGLPAMFESVWNCGIDPLEVSNLQSLSVTATLTAKDVERTSSDVVLDWDVILAPFEHAVLRDLKLLTECDEGYAFPHVRFGPMLRIDLAEVTTLSLNTSHVYDMLVLLPLCPFVTSLSIFSDSEHGYEAHSEVLPHIDTLILKDVENLPRYLKCPRLRHLTVTGNTHLDSLLELLSQSHCSLETLDVQILFGNARWLEALGEIAKLLQTLKTLVIRTHIHKLDSILPHFTSASVLLQVVSLKLRVSSGSDLLFGTDRCGTGNLALEQFLEARIANSPLLREVDILFFESHSWNGTKEPVSMPVPTLPSRIREWKDTGVVCIHVGQMSELYRFFERRIQADSFFFRTWGSCNI